MILISHRGNIDGPNQDKENTHRYIQEALDAGYHVEIDVWLINDKLFLGHDEPEISVCLDWITSRRQKLWVHAKNEEALFYLTSNTNLTVFFHEKEKYSIIHNGRDIDGNIIKGAIWAHNLEKLSKNCIIPLLNLNDLPQKPKTKILGICSDYVELIK
ncbi:hypothetical protein N9A98_00020 [Akkermansiaceae bacterium]|nr:hypothetical protein [Akkermansiaceae bacterium]